MVAASSSLVFAFGLGAATGPTAAATAMRIAGPGGLFMLAFVVCLLYTAFIIHRMRIRHWAPVVEKEQYVPMPEVIATPVASGIDPRAEVDDRYDQTDEGES